MRARRCPRVRKKIALIERPGFGLARGLQWAWRARFAIGPDFIRIQSLLHRKDKQMRHLPRLIPAALRAAAVCLLAAGALPGGAFALGLGEIAVKSAYSKGFVAEIPVFLDQGESDLKAAVGTQDDYNMIQIGRPAFIDGLSVTVENAAAGKVIVIRSKEPITQPSFNLIIRATASGGAVLENYFLAVDFRKSLSLDLPPPEEHAAEAPKQEKKGASSASSLPMPVPAVTPLPAPVVPPPAPAPTPLSAPVAAPASEPAAQASAPSPPAAEPPPVPAVDREELKVVAAKAVPAEPPAPIAAEKAPVEEAAPAPPVLAKIDADPAKNRVTVKRGDTLFGIGRTLEPAAPNLSRVVVAIYMENKDAFIDGNIHRLRAGAKLDYRRVNERAAGVSDEEARQLLSDNLKELQKPESAEPAAASIELPFEKPVSEQDVADFLEQWRTEWMAKSPGFADRYAANFRGFRGHLSAAANKAEWIAARSAFNELHDNMTVTLADVKTTRGGVSFTQTFASDQLFSVGQKSLALARENGVLKITEERIDIKKAIDRTHSWTVAFPAVQSREIALTHLQQLRKMGFSAYEANGMPNGPYALAAGRFATRALAEDFHQKLKSVGEREAKVVLLPFSVRMKIAEDPAAAAAAMAALAENGYFPFEAGMAADGKTRRIVCVGAFATREAAVKARDALKIEGFDPQPVIP